MRPAANRRFRLIRGFGQALSIHLALGFLIEGKAGVAVPAADFGLVDAFADPVFLKIFFKKIHGGRSPGRV
jgi:hypothetical protein